MSHDFDTRFLGIARLLTRNGLDRLRQSHVAVVGLGGVGSWTVEALARSGIGRLSLIDLDEVCLGNVNRQLHALDGTVGQPKAEVLAERVRRIHPGAEVIPIVEFFTEATAERLLAPGFDAVVDAIDAVGNKCRLLAGCAAHRIPVIACGGAGGRLDPTRIRVTDLADATHDRLLTEVRKRLRREHGFPGFGKSMGVPCVTSPETPITPEPECAEASASPPPNALVDTHAALPGPGPRARTLNCDWGYGSATFVTGAFGFAAASWVIRRLASATRPGSDRHPPNGKGME